MDLGNPPPLKHLWSCSISLGMAGSCCPVYMGFIMYLNYGKPIVVQQLFTGSIYSSPHWVIV